ncbi:hypothetical protein N9Y82_02965 [Amylibacter sp.]|nr:hypothetical protein [Amylibacter sp.]
MINKITSKPVLRVSDVKKFLFFTETSFKLPKGYRQAEWLLGGAQAMAIVCEKVAQKKNRKIKVALPGFFCGQTIRFLRSMPVELVFYQLLDDLTPDFQNLQQQSLTDHIDILILVHYFGTVKAQKDARMFANSNNMILLEDAAHVMTVENNYWQGDYIIFSPHKHFVSPPIGLLIHKEEKKLNDVGNLKFANFPVLWMAKQLVRTMIRSRTAPWGAVWNSHSQNIDTLSPNSHSIKRAIYNLKNHNKDRRLKKYNAISLCETLTTVSGWTPFQLTSGIETPYLFAMICDDRHIASRRYGLLNVQNPIVNQWPDLPYEIDESKIIREQVTDLLDRVLYFPIHGQLNTVSWLKEITRIVNIKGF